MQQRRYVLFSNGTRKKINTDLDLVPCTLNHWNNQGYGVDWQYIYSLNNFQDWLCPKLDQKLLIGGTYTSENYYFIKF